MADAILGRSKYPDERFVIAWDYVDDLDTDDGLDSGSCTVTATDQDGHDVSATVLEGANVFESQLRVTLKAGTSGDTLYVKFVGITNNTSRFERVVQVRVRA